MGMGRRESGDRRGDKGRIWASGSEMPPDSYIPGGRMPCLWWTSSAKCSQAPRLAHRGQAYPGFWVKIMSSPQHRAGLHPIPLLPTHHGWLPDGFRGGRREGRAHGVGDSGLKTQCQVLCARDRAGWMPLVSLPVHGKMPTGGPQRRRKRQER